MAAGIKDKVAILGMGCSRFGERWDAGSEQLMLEACSEALHDAGIEREEVGAAWLGSANADPVPIEWSVLKARGQG